MDHWTKGTNKGPIDTIGSIKYMIYMGSFDTLNTDTILTLHNNPWFGGGGDGGTGYGGSPILIYTFF